MKTWTNPELEELEIELTATHKHDRSKWEGCNPGRPNPDPNPDPNPCPNPGEGEGGDEGWDDDGTLVS